MKIALIYSEDFSLGVAALSAYLKSRGHEAKVIFDPRQFNKSYAQNKFLARIFDRTGLIVRDILSFSPDLIGFSVFTSNYQWALRLASEIKKRSETPIMFGGVHPSLVAEEVLKEKAVDMVCIGEGEEPLCELLDNIKDIDYSIKNIWFRKDGQVIRNELRPLKQDLDSLPFADRQPLYNQLPRNYSRYPIVMTSFGCPFRCSYCANNALAEIYKGKGQYIRRRSPENVIREIRAIKEKYHSKYIIFMDDLFTYDSSWLAEFAPLYRVNIGLPYSCLTHAKFLSRQVCESLKESGCNLVLLGLQSGSEKTRREVLRRPETNDDYRNAVKLLKEHKIKFSLDSILNIPYDTRQTISDSLNLCNELRPDLIHPFSLVYFPRIEIIHKGISAGILPGDIESAINRGVYQNYMSVQLASQGDYRRYSLIFAIIPLFSYSIIKRIINNEKALRLVARLPLSLVLLAKFILNIRAGTGFVFHTVFANEFYYLRGTLFRKLINRRSKRERQNEVLYT